MTSFSPLSGSPLQPGRSASRAYHSGTGSTPGPRRLAWPNGEIGAA
jgi:hypothetical protein